MEQDMGWRVFPCGADKKPLIKDWQRLATDDPEQIRRWQEVFRERLALWGLPTGEINDILALDVDVKTNGFASLQGLEIPPTLAQWTRSGGAHYLFRYPRNGRHYGNRTGLRPGLDVRGSGGYICVYGLNDTPIADPPTWFVEEAGRTAIAQAEGPIVRIAPEIVDGILKETINRLRGAGEGERNDTLNVEAFRMGQLVASQAITREYAENQLFQAAIELHMPASEARATITSGLNGGIQKPLTSPFANVEPVPQIPIPPPPAPPARWSPQAFTRSDMTNVAKLKKPQLFKDWLTEDISLTTADGGTGKTTLELYQAVCLALGESFLGFECLTGAGRTLYITGEDTEAKLAAIIGQIMKTMGLWDLGQEARFEQVRQSIFVRKDADMTIVTRDKSGFFHPNQDAMRKILEAVEDIKPKLIVLDPIASFWGSEAALNDMAKAVAKFVGELVERSGAAVEMLNHMGKASSQAKDMTQFAGRGGTGLPSHARVSRVMHQVYEEEYLELTGEPLAENQSCIKVVVNKFSDGSPLYNKPFLVVRQGFTFSRRVLSAAKEREAEKSMTDIERVFTFVREERRAGRFPTQKVIVAHFMTDNEPISEARVKRAVYILEYTGHMGEKIKEIENPDASVRDRVFIVTDAIGQEL
jgi:RecA-family ATPase